MALEPAEQTATALRTPALAATVLIPTHNHGPLLRYAIDSVLRQTVTDFELFVIGDGADEATRAVARQAAQSDDRVRFFDFPKGPRHGEVHRHAALQEARGEIVCYLADDDLYLPTHLEAMRAMLRDADFAHAATLRVEPDGRVMLFCGHLDSPGVKERMQGKWNFIPLGCGGHTWALYERLPHGWRTTPDGTWTDLYMWRQILSVEGCRAVSGMRTTVVHFPSSLRTDWPPERREAELAAWAVRVVQAGFEIELAALALDAAVRENYEHGVRLDAALRANDELSVRLNAVSAQLELHHAAARANEASIRDLSERLATTTTRATAVAQRVADLERLVAAANETTQTMEAALHMSQVQAREAEARVGELIARTQHAGDEIRRLTQEAASVRAESDAAISARDEQIAAASRSLAAIESTLTWRLRQRLIRLPLLAPTVRAAARLVSRPPTP